MFPAHTISQRLRGLKRIPPELIPLGMSRYETAIILYLGTLLIVFLSIQVLSLRMFFYPRSYIHIELLLPPPFSPFNPADGYSSVALGAAGYSLTNKLLTDKTLRLYRNSPEQREH